MEKGVVRVEVFRQKKKKFLIQEDAQVVDFSDGFFSQTEMEMEKVYMPNMMCSRGKRPAIGTVGSCHTPA